MTTMQNIPTHFLADCSRKLLVLLLIIDFTIGLRVTREDELQGLDLSQHSEQIG